jgi:hypothetical protein
MRSPLVSKKYETQPADQPGEETVPIMVAESKMRPNKMTPNIYGG